MLKLWRYSLTSQRTNEEPEDSYQRLRELKAVPDCDRGDAIEVKSIRSE